MVRILNNDEIESNFSVVEYVDIAEEMFKKWGEGKAASTPSETIHSKVNNPPDNASTPVFHAMRTAGGSIKGMNVSAIRLNSDLKHWPEKNDVQVQERIPISNNRYNGLVFLFDNETGEILLMFSDGAVQTYHVAGGVAVGTKHLANENSSTLGMYGVGHQADAHLPALDHVTNLDLVKVYSPTQENREEFAERMDEKISPKVLAVDNPKEVSRNADIVNCATNSTEPVFNPGWLEPGTHVNYIRPSEIPKDIFKLKDVEKVVLSKANQGAVDLTGDSITGYLDVVDKAADPWRFFVMDADPLAPKLQSLPTEKQPVDDVAIVRLPSVMTGNEIGRSSNEEITIFRQIGHGVAFAAIGHILHRKTQKYDLGVEIPTEYFTQSRVP